MKSNELRIGNLVWSNYGAYDRLEDYVVLLHEDFLLTKGHGKSNIAFHFIEPIPLTKDWGLKFGGELVEDGFDSEAGGLVCMIEFGRFRIRWDAHRKHWRVVMSDYKEDYIATVRYVHQLQNLYFALTGEELTIKEQ